MKKFNELIYSNKVAPIAEVKDEKEQREMMSFVTAKPPAEKPREKMSFVAAKPQAEKPRENLSFIDSSYFDYI